MISLTFVILLTQVDLLTFFDMTHAIQNMTENAGVIWNANLFEVLNGVAAFQLCRANRSLIYSNEGLQQRLEV